MKRRTFLLNLLAGFLARRNVHAGLPKRPPAGETPDATVYRSLNAAPDVNLNKVLELMGGIQRFIGADDVVALKPNVQWWNHGVPNILVVKTLVDAVFNRKGGFDGEVAIIENVHRGPSPWRHAGWAHPFERNADIKQVHDYNGLCRNLKKKYGDQFSTVHLINAKDGGRRVCSPEEGRHQWASADCHGQRNER